MSSDVQDSEDILHVEQVENAEYEMYDVVSDEGDKVAVVPMVFLRNVLGPGQALRASDGDAENTFVFWFEAGERNGLQWRNINWTAPKPASETDAHSVLDDAEELTLQIVPKEDWT